MRRVYTTDEYPAFIDSKARDLLEEGRREFRKMGFEERSFVELGNDSIWIPWVGDRTLNAIELALRREGLNVEATDLLLRANESETVELKRAARRVDERGIGDLVELAYSVKNKQIEKHHTYLREDLLAMDYASQYLSHRT
jgi:ATP-dependent Lhr-like helicase